MFWKSSINYFFFFVRIGKTGTLTTVSKDMDDDVKKNTSQGTFAVLEFNKLSTLFIAGGLPDDVQVTNQISIYSNILDNLL